MDSFIFRTARIPSITKKQVPRERIERLVLPSAPASFQRPGKVPTTNPIKAQVTKTVFFSKSIAAIPDNPIKPTAIPSNNTPIMNPCFFIPVFNDDNVSMSGRYIPKATQSVPPLIPGRIAPKPTTTPSKSHIRLNSNLVFRCVFISNAITSLL